ncbi:DUF411 domain-containing protein [Reinekea sp.]|jgi:hypothetical protein|uniref:DUF411 domain-containing protein n=1 Tax=Reinekea sp. TaxID=1970455 RepID=UPI0039898353
MKKINRLLVMLIALSSFVWAESMTVYKSPTCGCCTEWIAIMEKAGHDVTVIHPYDLQKVKDELGLPRQLGSCHTAVIQDYIFEGHIPEADILSFLANPPENAKGLAVPGMPGKSPGMARPGEKYENFNVVQFSDENKLSLYRRY